MSNTPLSTAQAARILGVNVTTVNRMVAAGRLTPVVQGEGRTGARFFDPADVDREAAARRQALMARMPQVAS